MAKHYVGDTGLFRRALDEAGYTRTSDRTIFNDKFKSSPERRLKLWTADNIFVSPLKQQRKLEKSLRKLFGDRIKAMYFVPGMWWNSGLAPESKSLCIKLHY